MNKKIVLITGTNSGFGWLTAKAVASLGHKVYTFPTEMSQKIQSGSDTSIEGAYEVLTEAQNNFFSAVGQLLESVNPNPQDVADTVVKLIDSPKGQRPLRTVVDPTTGKYVKTANDTVQAEYEKTLTAYGMQNLLK
ncbi:hypothetical protein LZF95_05995 [Algoriphagus sp. AGSA1]|uniref:hypothetical protein n=1 Tax=Algoriphagus sp. AGSA1 TaxID=2907213 RepID=UPI001F2B4F28|nr:hypothetical protein [Algoriphagus sp. AGSA1]MCE7054219.1 hypothetical protein [Algoriphagus sp. AGSA1]